MRLAAAALVAVAAAGSSGAGATPRTGAPLLTFALGPGLGVCATDLEGHTFRLADPRQWDADLSWSPDGSQLVFRSGQSTVSFVDAEGHNKGILSWPSGDGENSSTSVSGLAWSPDSRSLAGVVTTAYHYGGYRSELWVSQGQRRTLYYGGVIGQPSWSPDGSRIAFSDSTGKTYFVDPDGRNLRKVLDSAEQPVWSPDGQRLAFTVLGAERQRVGLAIARADGSGQQLLTEGKVLSPAWSPDGSVIAFTRDLGTSHEIDVIKPDGTDERRLAGGAVLFPGPVWSPDGDAVAYARGKESGPLRIAVVRPDGTNERIVETSLPGAGLSFPAWRRPAPLPTHRRACVVTGTPGADVLRGRERGDVLFGGAGNDRLYGAGGKDVLFGGSGHDRLFGGAGNDLFNTRDAKRDYLFGGPGWDQGSYDLYRDRVKSVERYIGG